MLFFILNLLIYFCYLGNICFEDINECFFGFCVNNGICRNLIVDFNCICFLNYIGKRCEIEKLFCEFNNFCLNNGICRLYLERYNFMCECVVGFVGLCC